LFFFHKIALFYLLNKNTEVTFFLPFFFILWPH